MRERGLRMGWLGGLAALLALMVATPFSAAEAQRSQATSGPARTGSLRPLRSDAEFTALLRRLRAWQEENPPPPPPPPPPPAPPPPPPPPGQTAAAEAPAASADGITNVQEAGVDEGGIVKVRGDILVILRRGRLFTISTAGGGMRAIDRIDAFPPGVGPSPSQWQADWYDEMLISGDWVVVVGYSYARGGTEINRFRLSPEGRLSFVDAYHLRSNDYYSAENYASRLIGNRLIFYTPLFLRLNNEDASASLPGIKKWNGNAADRNFRPIIRPNRIYVSRAMLANPDGVINTLHSVTTCDLTAPELECAATGVLGPASRQFYVAASGVYLWMAGNEEQTRRFPFNRYIFRLPFGNEPPSAIGARGDVRNQFAFREDPADGVLNILVQAADYGGGEMWQPQAPPGTIALLRVPLADFGDGSREVRQRFYRFLPNPTNSTIAENRFIGGHIVYGLSMYGGQGSVQPTAVAASLREPAATPFPLRHRIDRIEAMGTDAVAIGSGQDGSLGFTALDLGQAAAREGDFYAMPAAQEGESRSQAFFYNPDRSTPDGASGVLGLPIARPIDGAYYSYARGAAAMMFLRRRQRQFSPAGTLDAEVRTLADDGCVASCVDWYGNARPIFLRGRTFALLGYELVEGRLGETGNIVETGRLNFAPRRP